MADHEQLLVVNRAVRNRFVQLQHRVFGRNSQNSALDGQFLAVIKTKGAFHDLVQTRGWMSLGIQSDTFFRDIEDVIRLEQAGDFGTDGYRIHDAEVASSLTLL